MLILLLLADMSRHAAVSSLRSCILNGKSTVRYCCVMWLQAELQAKYLQPIAKVKVYTQQEEQNHMARVQRLVEGLGAFG